MRFLLLLILLFFFIPGFSQQRNEKLNLILQQSKTGWKQYQSDHFKFFVKETLYADQQIDSVKDKLERERIHIIDFLEQQSFTDTANIIIVDTKEKIKNLLGFEVQGFAIPENNMVIFLYSKDYSLAARHELTHYYLFHTWGRPADNWFSEGLAVYNDQKWSGYQVDSLCKHLKDNSKLLKMATLSKKFHALNAMIAYPQIGSFTGFLLSAYGKPKVKELWNRGFGEIKAIYGKSLKELEKEWLQHLDSMQPNTIDYSRHL